MPGPARACPCMARMKLTVTNVRIPFRCWRGGGMATPLCSTLSRCAGIRSSWLRKPAMAREGATVHATRRPTSASATSRLPPVRPGRTTVQRPGLYPSASSAVGNTMEGQHDRGPAPGHKGGRPGRPGGPGHGRCRGLACASSLETAVKPWRSVLDRTCAWRSRLRGQPAPETGSGPAMVTSGPPGRAASSLARLDREVYRVHPDPESAGRPLSWPGATDAGQVLDRVERAKRVEAACDGGQERGVGEVFHEARGMRSACVAGRHQPGRLVTAEVKPAAATAANT